jgi:Mn-dependent DtxR family transcriptional regulator
MAGPALTEAIQDYLKAIYKLQENDSRRSRGSPPAQPARW